LRSLSESAAFDPEKNEQLEARLDLIRRLERKYGSTVEDMIAYTKKIGQEYAAFQHMDETLDDIQEIQKKRLSEYKKEAEALTDSRKKLAAWFEEEMIKQLNQLGMKKTKFSVQFLSSGTHEAPEDEVAFLISPNPGEPLKPLARIASGGELSRLMLAIKSIAALKGLIPTMIFDEIDTGISGKIAQVVAEKMAKISSYRQVLCVTHLPQIAAMADYHYLVEKNVQEDRTYTTVSELSESLRERELARMLGGSGSENDSGLMHARNMLKASSELKNGLVYKKK
jgi:DNA repair protein RecN (Recombination protein N)